MSLAKLLEKVFLILRKWKREPEELAYLLYALVTELDTDANTILAIQNKQGNISVDEELRKLSPEMRTYFSQQFVQMIKEIPN